jgi:hypothetical protein
MENELLERAFGKMGARLKVEEPRSSRFLRPKATAIRLDVRRDKKGEYFFVSKSKEDKTELVVLDVEPEDRHLLLLTRAGKKKARFLAGHDERPVMTSDTGSSQQFRRRRRSAPYERRRRR